MRYIQHHAILVSSWNDGDISAAREKAISIFTWVSPISPPGMNSYRSFFIPPDGSKEGRHESDIGDSRRKKFVKWLDAQRCSDGSTSLDWVEVQFGDDELEAKIINDSDAHAREGDPKTESAKI